METNKLAALIDSYSSSHLNLDKSRGIVMRYFTQLQEQIIEIEEDNLDNPWYLSISKKEEMMKLNEESYVFKN
jgi:hypothetical protein